MIAGQSLLSYCYCCNAPGPAAKRTQRHTCLGGDRRLVSARLLAATSATALPKQHNNKMLK